MLPDNEDTDVIACSACGAENANLAVFAENNEVLHVCPACLAEFGLRAEAERVTGGDICPQCGGTVHTDEEQGSMCMDCGWEPDDTQVQQEQT